MPQESFDIGQALETGWNMLGKRPGALLGWGVVTFLVIGAYLGSYAWAAWNSPDHQAPMYFKAIQFVINIVVTLLYTKVVFLCLDDRPADAGSVFSVFTNSLSYLVGSFLFTLGAGIGFLLLVVPGIIFSLGFGQFTFAIIDKGLGPVESLKRSWEITKGVRLKLFLFGIVNALVMFAGMLCFVVGLIPASIICSVAMVHVYRQLEARAGAIA
ncbi:MAG TPA: hypothetical protein V6D17_18330 [Candidatus Obscuribacterales bacterium]